jgi:hypothetical protein
MATVRTLLLIAPLQLFKTCPDVSLFRIPDQLLKPAHAGLVTNEQLEAAGVTNHIRLALLGLSYVATPPTEGTGKQVPLVQTEVEWHRLELLIVNRILQ